GVDYFQTFSPTMKMTTLRVLLHVAFQRDYELHSLHFSTAFLQGSLLEEIWLRRPPGFTGSFPAGTQWSLRRPVYRLDQAPREWHDTLRTTLAALGFSPSTSEPSLFLRTDTSQPPFYVLVYVDDLVFATADTEALTLVMSELQKRHTCTDLGELRSYLGLQITRDRARCTITPTQSHMVHQVLQRFGFQFSSPQPTPVSTSHSLSAPPLDESVEPSGALGCCEEGTALLVQYVGHGARAWRTGSTCPHWYADASWVDDLATQRSSQGYTFSLGSGSVSWWSTRSSSVLSSSCEVEIYAGAMAAQKLRWLTYMLIDLGEQPHSPPVLSNNGSPVTSPSRPTASPAADNSHLQQQQQQHQYQQQPMYGMPLSSQPVHTTTAAASSTAAVATAATAASTSAAAVPGSSSQPGQQSNFVSTGPYQYQVEEDFSLHLNEVLLVPRLGFNLMSSAQLMKNGITLLSEPGKFTLKYGEKKLGTAVEQNGVFVLNFIPERTTADSGNILSLGPWEHRDDIDYTDDTVGVIRQPCQLMMECGELTHPMKQLGARRLLNVLLAFSLKLRNESLKWKFLTRVVSLEFNLYLQHPIKKAAS
ncbi:unnamed protein product, partial [Closterium sp. NIES-54]